MSKTQRKKSISIHVKRKEVMSKEGIQRWNKKLRLKVRKFIYRPMPHVTKLPTSVNNKEKLAQWLFENFGCGSYHIHSYRPARTKYKVGLTKASKVEIIPLKDPTGEKPYVANFLDIRPISRRAFWTG